MHDYSDRTTEHKVLASSKNATRPPSSFTCVPLTSDDCEQTARIYMEVFLRDETTSRRHAPDPVRFLPYTRFYVDFCRRKQLSFIARDQEKDEVIGFILCSDLVTDWDAEGTLMTAFLSHFHETVVAIDELERRCFDLGTIPPGTFMHVFQIGVTWEFRGLSVSTTLIRRVLAHAREQGFHQVIADCTSQESCHSFERCGFYEVGRTAYDTISINGTRFFTGLEGGISLMARDLLVSGESLLSPEEKDT